MPVPTSTDHTPSALAVDDLVIPQGATESATWPKVWEYAEGDPAAPPTGWPGSWTARMQIRDYYGEGSIVLATLHSSDPADGTLTLTSNLDPGDGLTYARITPYIDPAVSAAWAWADLPDCVFDLEITDGVRLIRHTEGNVWLSREVTTVG